MLSSLDRSQKYVHIIRLVRIRKPIPISLGENVRRLDKCLAKSGQCHVSGGTQPVLIAIFDRASPEVVENAATRAKDLYAN